MAKGDIADRLLAAAARRGTRAGLSGRGGTWLALGLAATALRRLRSKRPVVVVETLEPGQRLEIAHLAPPPKARRKQR